MHGDAKYIKNRDHMLYCSWDMACDGCICYLTKCPDKNSYLLAKKKIEKHSLTQNFDTLHCFLASSVCSIFTFQVSHSAFTSLLL